MGGKTPAKSTCLIAEVELTTDVIITTMIFA